jgi:hypothetical protein
MILMNISFLSLLARTSNFIDREAEDAEAMQSCSGEEAPLAYGSLRFFHQEVCSSPTLPSNLCSACASK